MALTALAGFLVSDPVAPLQYAGTLSLPGVKVGDLIVAVPFVGTTLHTSYAGSYTSSFKGRIDTDDEVIQPSDIDPNYANLVQFIILRPSC